MKRECPVCGIIHDFKRSKNKFCSRECYRKNNKLLKEAWRLNPPKLIDIKNYGEFIDQKEIPCIVCGCEWKGKSLSAHMLVAHGANAEDVKKKLGFNVNAGLISKPLHDKFSKRGLVGVAINVKLQKLGSKSGGGWLSTPYRSKQKKESAKIGRGNAAKTLPKPERTCIYCNEKFIQSTPFGRAKYCSLKCRNKHYYRLGKFDKKA